MTLVSYPEVGNYYNAFKKTNKELAAINMPCDYVAAGCGGYAIFVDKANEIQTLTTGETAKTVDLCWDFIKFIISKEGQNIAGKEGYIQPILKELSDSGDWLQSYEGKIDNKAFETGKELPLDSYTFADPAMRNDLRVEIGQAFFKLLFDKKTSSYTSMLEETLKSVKDILAGN